MKFVLLALVALLAFTSSINAEDKSQEQAVRKVLADFAEALNRGVTGNPEVSVRSPTSTSGRPTIR
jgi:hypothetical protein